MIPEQPNPQQQPATSPASPPVPTDSNPDATLRAPIHYIPIFIFGCLTVFAVFITFGLLISLGLGALVLIAIVFQGFENALIIATVIIAALSGRFLRRYVYQSAYTITSLALAGVCAAGLALNKVVPDEFTLEMVGEKATGLQAVVSNPLIQFGGALLLGGLLFVVLTFLLNGSTRRKLLVVPYVLLVVGLLFFTFTHKGSPNDDLLSRTVGENGWAITATYLPSGVVDGAGAECKKNNTESTSYTCEYFFKNYPGYLSAETKATIDTVGYHKGTPTTPDTYSAPTPFIRVDAYKVNPVLAAYTYKDGQCDISNLREVGSSLGSRIQAPEKQFPPKPQKCASVTTPGGKTLYYESPQNYSRLDPLNVPVSYYFEQDNVYSVLSIGGYMSYAAKNDVRSLYIVDPNYQAELFKFVDSFQPVR